MPRSLSKLFKCYFILTSFSCETFLQKKLHHRCVAGVLNTSLVQNKIFISNVTPFSASIKHLIRTSFLFSIYSIRCNCSYLKGQLTFLKIWYLCLFCFWENLLVLWAVWNFSFTLAVLLYSRILFPELFSLFRLSSTIKMWSGFLSIYLLWFWEFICFEKQTKQTK